MEKEKEKQQIVFIHGGEAFDTYEAYLADLYGREYNPHEEKEIRFKDTLSEDLGEEFEVFQPQMPSKGNAKYAEWRIWFEKVFPYLHEDVILVGHSLGGIFLAKYLAEESFPKKAKALFLLAAPFEEAEGEGSLADFYLPSDISNIEGVAENIFIFHSEDDFVVPYEAGKHYELALPTATLATFQDRGHFLQRKLPELIKCIRELCDTKT